MFNNRSKYDFLTANFLKSLFKRHLKRDNNIFLLIYTETIFKPKEKKKLENFSTQRFQ